MGSKQPLTTTRPHDVRRPAGPQPAGPQPAGPQPAQGPQVQAQTLGGAQIPGLPPNFIQGLVQQILTQTGGGQI